ncbi:DUF2383 domain-containing protein [Legionella gresilensis]|uniref:DUF2383 domain-containing protein n=1 Tax=Legionella gresilensis TaxID=91823 RepID=UPI0010413D38|nr:ferritin-like domain-containing protein [Legionella gresilensis]
MTTSVGVQAKFHNALYALCELDFDAVAAYKVAIDRLESEVYKERLSEFMEDHKRHIKNITNILKVHKKEIPTGPDIKQYLTKGKIVLANIFGDKAILKAMVTNEIDTNTAYERVSEHANKWPEATAVIIQGLNDERRHKKWLETVIEEN